MTTNANAIFVFGVLTNQWDGAGTPNYWMGLNGNWTNGASNCTDWSSNAAVPSGSYGSDLSTGSGSIITGTFTCNTSANMYILCAEQ